MVSVALALSPSESGLFLLPWVWRRIAVGPHGAVPRGIYWGSHEGWVFQFSLDWELLASSLSFPESSHLGSHGSLSRVSISPVWSTGWFRLLGAGIRTVSPVLSLASSHSGVCAMRVGVRPCSLAHCGAPWLVAWRPCHCLITAGLAIMDSPQLACAVESQLCCRPSHGGTAPVDWIRGVFPCFDHLPSF